jgi:hypothetical protein
MNERFEKIITTITEKLEDHEKYDNRRFDNINTGLWEIRLQNAASQDGILRKKAETKQPGTGSEENCVRD